MIQKLGGPLVALALVMGGASAWAETAVEKAETKIGVMHSEERAFTNAYKGAAQVQADLMANQWEEAGKDILKVRQEITDLASQEKLNAAARLKLQALRPALAELQKLINVKDAVALERAGHVVTLFGDTAVGLAKIGWMKPAGGGAGTGVPPKKHMDPKAPPPKDGKEHPVK